MRIINNLRNIALTTTFSIAPFIQPVAILNAQPRDVFIYTNNTNNVPASGTSSPEVLQSAPSPSVNILGKKRNATIVVDLNKNILYKYDTNGIPTNAYLIASGKKSTPTDPGLRVVSHIETFPYKNAPRKTKRRRSPRNYGPKIIILEKLDPSTGIKSKTGEFIHGNNDPSSIGKYASKGCMRMDNEVIKVLAKQVKRDDIVKIIK